MHVAYNEPLNVHETALYTQAVGASAGNGTVSGYSNHTISNYIDDTHGWEADTLAVNVSNLTDERNWVQNSYFGSEGDVSGTTTNISSSPVVIDTDYTDDMESDPTKLPNRITSREEVGADYIRLHFNYIDIEEDWDMIYLWEDDGSNYNLLDSFIPIKSGHIFFI